MPQSYYARLPQYSSQQIVAAVQQGQVTQEKAIQDMVAYIKQDMGPKTKEQFEAGRKMAQEGGGEFEFVTAVYSAKAQLANNINHAAADMDRRVSAGSTIDLSKQSGVLETGVAAIGKAVLWTIPVRSKDGMLQADEVAIYNKQHGTNFVIPNSFGEKGVTPNLLTHICLGQTIKEMEKQFDNAPKDGKLSGQEINSGLNAWYTNQVVQATAGHER